MTSLKLLFFALGIFCFCHSALSLSCESEQKFSTKKSFANCGNLPYHNATLHWTYDALLSTLSMAFVAPPPTPDGWVAWAINPNGTGMVGSQALIAYKQKNGSMAVKPYHIKSYHSVKEGSLQFNVTDVEAEYDDDSGKMVIYGTWTLPEQANGTLNQVWQVGPSVVKGKPVKHQFDSSSLASKGKLHLVDDDQTGDPNGEGDYGSLGSPEGQYGNSTRSLPLYSPRMSGAPMPKMTLSRMVFYGMVASVAVALLRS
ncbi:hypothetical protein Droror1_Dr00003897 [Drosera rotundifolia]